MPLEWTHAKCGKPGCDATRNCPSFPTVEDRIVMAQAAYGEYAEPDGTSLLDFALDVLSLYPHHPQFDQAIAKQNARTRFYFSG